MEAQTMTLVEIIKELTGEKRTAHGRATPVRPTGHADTYTANTRPE
jgi:hypothetical protein